MLFGLKTRSVSDFLPRVLAHIDGIDADMVRSYIMDAAIQFLRDTKIFTEVKCIQVNPCITSYKIESDYYITEVLSVRFFLNDRQIPSYRFAYWVIDGVLHLGENPIYDSGDVRVEVEVSVAPYRDSEELPEFLYQEWVDAITELSLSKLFLQLDNEWYNPQAAAAHLQLYERLVKQAQVSRLTKHKPLSMRLLNKRRM